MLCTASLITLADRWLWAIGLVSAASAALDVSFWVTLPAAGLVYAAAAARRFDLASLVVVAAVLLALWTEGNPPFVRSDVPVGTRAETQGGNVGAVALFVSGLKAGLLTFGGAYTAIPFVRVDAVGRGWITEGQFLDSWRCPGSFQHR